MKDLSLLAFAVIFPSMMMMFAWFCRTVVQGSLRFDFKALGVHLEGEMRKEG